MRADRTTTVAETADVEQLRKLVATWTALVAKQSSALDYGLHELLGVLHDMRPGRTRSALTRIYRHMKEPCDILERLAPPILVAVDTAKRGA
jgi:hypothetical protein